MITYRPKQFTGSTKAIGPSDKGKWKLVAVHGRPWELYDLEADRTELDNLAQENPEKLEQLKAMYQSWAKRCEVLPWPIRKRRQP